MSCVSLAKKLNHSSSDIFITCPQKTAMTQYFVIVIFLSCNLVPKGIDKFTLKVHPRHDHKHQMEVIYEYECQTKSLDRSPGK